MREPSIELNSSQRGTNIRRVLTGAAALLTCTAAAPVTGQCETVLIPDGAQPASFAGEAVSAHDQTMVVGCPGIGQASVFGFSDSSWVEEQSLLDPDGATSHNFGHSVDTQGEFIVIGAPNHDALGIASGAVYVFRNEDGSWVEDQVLFAWDGGPAFKFGDSVAIDGDRIVVGAPARDDYEGGVYVFEFDGTDWKEDTFLLPQVQGGWFGRAVAVSGNRIASGAIDNEAAFQGGAVFVHELIGSDWVLIQKLMADDAENYDLLGASVAIDTNTVVAGAPKHDYHKGAAYVFHDDGETWEQAKLMAVQPASSGLFGTSVAISDNMIAVGEPKASSSMPPGIVFVFSYDESQEIWTDSLQLQQADGNPGEFFGSSVDIQGANVFAGAPSYGYDGSPGSGTGAAYAFGGDGLDDSCDPGASCPGDFNQNGQVGGEDLASLLGSWGQADGNPEDINGDGAVDPADLGLLLGLWGACP